MRRGRGRDGVRSSTRGDDWKPSIGDFRPRKYPRDAPPRTVARDAETRERRRDEQSPRGRQRGGPTLGGVRDVVVFREARVRTVLRRSVQNRRRRGGRVHEISIRGAFRARRRRARRGRRRRAGCEPSRFGRRGDRRGGARARRRRRDGVGGDARGVGGERRVRGGIRRGDANAPRASTRHSSRRERSGGGRGTVWRRRVARGTRGGVGARVGAAKNRRGARGGGSTRRRGGEGRTTPRGTTREGDATRERRRETSPKGRVG